MIGAWTRGPWGIEWGTDTAWIGPLRRDGTKVDSIVTSVDMDPGYRPEALEERRANVMLIATAPELADALDAALGEYTTIGFISPITQAAMRDILAKVSRT